MTRRLSGLWMVTAGSAGAGGSCSLEPENANIVLSIPLKIFRVLFSRPFACFAGNLPPLHLC